METTRQSQLTLPNSSAPRQQILTHLYGEIGLLQVASCFPSWPFRIGYGRQTGYKQEQTRGWPNQATCPLCRNQPEIAIHLFADCRFTRKVWASIAEWLAILALHPREWPQHDGDIHTWWTSRATSITNSRKSLHSLIMLTSWVIWKERNARILTTKRTRVTQSSSELETN